MSTSIPACCLLHHSYLPVQPVLNPSPSHTQTGLFLTGIGSCKTLNILWEHPGAHVPMNLLPTGLHQNVCSRHKCLNDGVFQLHRIRFLSSFHWISFFLSSSLWAIISLWIGTCSPTGHPSTGRQMGWPQETLKQLGTAESSINVSYISRWVGMKQSPKHRL